jgi:hypothetical protein
MHFSSLAALGLKHIDAAWLAEVAVPQAVALSARTMPSKAADIRWFRAPQLQACFSLLKNGAVPAARLDPVTRTDRERR